MTRWLHIYVLCGLIGGCAFRDTPYHFRAPMASAVRASDAWVKPAEDKERRRRVMTASGGSLTGPSRARVPRALATTRRALLDPGDGLAGSLRSLVGMRDDKSTSAEFVLRVMGGVVSSLDADLRGTRTGADLLAMARDRGAFDDNPRPRLGDLLIFDGVEIGARHSLVAIAVSQPRAGTYEFVYLARGVVRRGFFTPAFPDRRRHGDGAVANTFVRPGKSKDPRDTRYLAGELVVGVIKLDEMSQR